MDDMYLQSIKDSETGRDLNRKWNSSRRLRERFSFSFRDIGAACQIAVTGDRLQVDGLDVI